MAARRDTKLKGKRVIVGRVRPGCDDGRLAGEGRCSCRLPVHHHPPQGPARPPRPAAHCQVQCQGHARPSATARRNAGAAGGPARRQCLTDDRGTHRIAIFRKRRILLGHLTLTNSSARFWAVKYSRARHSRQPGTRSGSRRVGIPAVFTSCAFL